MTPDPLTFSGLVLIVGIIAGLLSITFTAMAIHCFLAFNNKLLVRTATAAAGCVVVTSLAYWHLA